MFKPSTIMAAALSIASLATTATGAFADQITTVSSNDGVETVTVQKMSKLDRRRQLALTVQGSVETQEGRGATGQPSVENEDMVSQSPGEFYAAY